MRYNILRYDAQIQTLLKKISFTPLEIHQPNLFEFIRFELYNVTPLYYWSPDIPVMPQYFGNVVKQIRQIP
jgi:hypothetical protein